MISRRLGSRTAALLLAGALAATACSSAKQSSAPRSSVAASAAPASTSAAPPTTAAAPVATLTKETAVSPIYGQGLARFGNGWIFSGTRWLARTDAALHQTAINAHAIPPAWMARGYDHIGDIDIVGNLLYAPFEQQPYSIGRQATAVYDATTLRFVSAVEVRQHENSFVTVDPRTMIAYSMDHFGGAALLRYDVRRAWAPLAPLQMSRFVDRVQGGDVAQGAAWLSTDDAGKGLYRVDLGTGHVDRLGTLGYPKGEGEGLDATLLPSGLLHALVVPPELVPVYLHDYRVGRRPT
jgi:hypothetical protein